MRFSKLTREKIARPAPKILDGHRIGRAGAGSLGAP
jgi:hypothetical protein